MRHRKLIVPTLLAGLLAVGCATARAQDDAPPEHSPPEEARFEEARERLEEASERLREAEERVEEAHRHASEIERDIADRRHDVHMRLQDIHEEIRDREAQLARLREEGRGGDDADAVHLREKLDALHAQAREVQEHAESFQKELEPAVDRVRESERDARRAAHELELLHRRLAGDGAPMPPPGEGRRRGMRGERGPGPRGIDRPGRGPGARFGPGAGPPDHPFEGDGRRGRGPGASDGDRIDRLERAVAELRALIERHGIDGPRRDRAMAEMERRRDMRGGRHRRGPGARGPDDRGPRRGAGPGGRVGGPGPGGPGPRGPGARDPGDGTPPPPDGGARRAEVQELRLRMERMAAENARLRAALEDMRRRMAELEAERR